MRREFVGALSARGSYGLLPNPRGSYGQGEDFTRANVKDFGHGDLSDTMAGIDFLTKKYPIDPNRLGITGWCCGGLVTIWPVSPTNRLRAALCRTGVPNWTGY